MSKKRATPKKYVKDPLWDAVPVIGAEGLVATVKDNDELIRIMKEREAKRLNFFDKG